MCSQYTLKIKTNDLSLNYDVRIDESIAEYDERFLPSKLAPVIVAVKTDLELTSMRFGLIPSWSKEPKVKFATHNARIETITEKPTWREPFKRQHCIIPMTAFYESVYEGPFAGHIIEFSGARSELLFAAGIFDHWQSPDTTFFSFSILTTQPSKFIADNGHDRSPLFLSFENAKAWSSLKAAPQNMVDFLLMNHQIPELKILKDRPLKAGWENRK